MEQTRQRREITKHRSDDQTLQPRIHVGVIRNSEDRKAHRARKKSEEIPQHCQVLQRNWKLQLYHGNFGRATEFCYLPAEKDLGGKQYKSITTNMF